MRSSPPHRPSQGPLATERSDAPRTSSMDSLVTSMMAVRAASGSQSRRPAYEVSEWPIVQATLPPVALSIEEYREHLERLERALYTRGRPCALMLDVRQHPPLDAVKRKLTAAFARNNEIKYPGLLRAVALVSSSPMVRGAFTAVAWVFPMKFPRKAFDRTAAAKVWLSEQVRPRS